MEKILERIKRYQNEINILINDLEQKHYEEKKSPLLYYHEAAKFLEIPLRKLYTLVKNGKINHCRYGPRTVRFLKTDVEAFMKLGWYPRKGRKIHFRTSQDLGPLTEQDKIDLDQYAFQGMSKKGETTTADWMN